MRAPTTCEHRHPEIGLLRLDAFPPSPQQRDMVISFSLEATTTFRLVEYEEPERYRNNLSSQWFNVHVFRSGERLCWQSTLPSPAPGLQQIGPWFLEVVKDTEEVYWDIPALNIDVPPYVSLDIRCQGGSTEWDLQIVAKNHSAIPLQDIELDIALEPEPSQIDAPLLFSGPRHMLLQLEPQETSKTISCSTRTPGILVAKLADKGGLLCEKRLLLSAGESDKSQSDSGSQGNQNVAVIVEDARNGRAISPGRGYYCVSPDRELMLRINPRHSGEMRKGQNSLRPTYVPSVKNVILNHPNISVGNIGKAGDREFSYTVKFLSNNPLTSKLIILYTVQYENGEERTQILAFKLKASVWGLLLVGMLFILPNLLDLIISSDLGWPKAALFTLVALLCLLMPFVYDRIQSSF